ncbi:Ig-like domain-containing protein [Bifidobacterium tsurumiense]|uniref:Ig-like domain-containing protein n=1 Tax=Bifidobacterium tsurumiense TaxID=356829 RepID=UPI003D1577CD
MHNTTAPTEAEAVIPTGVITDSFNVSTVAGTAPVLPESTKVSWSDDSQTDETITWDEMQADQYAQAGTFGGQRHRDRANGRRRRPTGLPGQGYSHGHCCNSLRIVRSRKVADYGHTCGIE